MSNEHHHAHHPEHHPEHHHAQTGHHARHHEHDHHEPKPHRIVVNGRPKEFVGARITYDELVKLAFPDGPFNVIYTVTYINRDGLDGTLGAGQSTRVTEEMEFHVGKTNRS